MYSSWLDGWDERRAAEGAKVKTVAEFEIGQALAFPEKQGGNRISEFIGLAEMATADRDYYSLPSDRQWRVEERGNLLRFPSPLTTGVAENDMAVAKVTKGRMTGRAVVIFHHWNATSGQAALATLLARLGCTVVEVSMPYHFQRRRPGSLYADHMLSANLGRTLQSIRQAVLDGSVVTTWLRERGYGQIGVLGMSLGSWVAGLVAAHDPRVTKASLFLVGDSLAEMVWTGRATREIRQSLEPHIGLDDLTKAWKPLDLGNYAERLARPGLSVHMVVATRDTVVLPSLSYRLLRGLHAAGVSPSVLKLPCGHYSLGMLPYSALAAISLGRFLFRAR